MAATEVMVGEAGVHERQLIQGELAEAHRREQVLQEEVVVLRGEVEGLRLAVLELADEKADSDRFIDMALQVVDA